MSRSNLVGLVLWFAVVTGCAGVSPSPSSWSIGDQAVVTTSGVVIEAEDGSFRLSAGDPIQTPFVTYDCPALPTTSNYALGDKLGARRVRVTHPDVSRPLYGLLAICHLHPDAPALVRRFYDIRIPSTDVAATTGGRVAVVYEPHGSTKYYADGAVAAPAWVLWIAREPF